jgi:hypothetical protein
MVLTYKTIKLTARYYYSGRRGYLLEYPVRNQEFSEGVVDTTRRGLAERALSPDCNSHG